MTAAGLFAGSSARRAGKDLIRSWHPGRNRGKHMNASLLAVLSDAERLLVAQTEPAELAALDFEEALSRASRRVAVLARQSAARLRAERIAASWTCRVHAGMNRRRARHPK